MRAHVFALVMLGAGLAASAASADDMFRTNVGMADFSGADLGVDLSAVMGASGSINTSGLGAGGHLGYNLQNGPIVGGVVGTMQFGNVSGGSASESYSYNSLGSLRARGGYALGPALFFASAGWAYSGAHYANLLGSTNQNLTGYVIGVGAEFAITRNLSVRGELSHFDFGNAIYYMPAGPSTASTSQNLITLGVATHF